MRLVRPLLALAAFFTLLSISAFLPLKPASAAPIDRPQLTQVFIVNNGWHTGIIVPAAPLQARYPQLRARFGDVAYFEIGWGDKGFYQAKDITAGIVIKALLGLSGSIMHIVAIPQDPQAFFKTEPLRPICISAEQLTQLNQAISTSLAQTDNTLTPLGKGLYGDSEFYAAEGAYYAFNTCNSWTAQRLSTAGLAVNPHLKLTADSVMRAIADLPAQCVVDEVSP